MTRVVTDKTLRAWLRAAPIDRGIGDGLTFLATVIGAASGKASWILRYRFQGKQRDEALGRYPDISLKEARELARKHRGRIQQGIDIAAERRAAARQQDTVATLAQAWYERHIASTYKHPEVVLRVIRRHIDPVIGMLNIEDVRPMHIDNVLTRIVEADAPTIANDALRYLFRMFHFALKRKWIETNPVSGFELSDAGGTEAPRQRWLNQAELGAFAKAMNFGRENELAVWLLLALCVRKMELLAAKWSEFDLEKGVWSLHPSRTKKNHPIDIPLAPQVLRWLEEVKVFSCGSEYLFPARRRVRVRQGTPRRNRFDHVCPDTLNVALRRLPLADIEHFTVHDMRRTARTHMAALGVDRFVAERALNHKVRDVEGGV
ncbi:MAG: tyrosine-type recombinase/integrase [Betaproteobacteria bacterium]|nr:tyrosine-type recombinase/integrase [Betaproteobacteria bacterium]